MKKFLLIARNWPEPNSSAAGRRTLVLLAMFAKQGVEVHVACAADVTPFQADLAALKYQTHDILLNDSGFDSWLQALAPDLVIFDRFVSEEQFGWRVRQQCPEALTILDTSDLHLLRFARQEAVKKKQPLNVKNDIALREVASILRCDLTLLISDYELNLLQSEFHIPPQLLHWLPFSVENSDIQRASSGFYERQHLMMVGGFKHEPNRDAVKWLKEQLWPEIKTGLPNDVELHVYGAYVDHKVQSMNDPQERFFIKGRAENLPECFQRYRLNLAPLRFGAGQKGKVLEGWLTGTPTITTAVGAESMASSDQLGYLLSDHENITHFVETTVRAYNEPDYWLELRQRGFDLLQSDFLTEQHAPALVERVQVLYQKLQEHRQENVFGRILWQQQFRATEFMSRWIELKQQKPGDV